MTVDSDGWAFRNEARSFSSGSALAVGPGRALAQGLKRQFRAMLGFADDACKTAVTYDRDKAGYRPGAILLQLPEFRARILRPQHAAVQHSRQRLIVDESRSGKHLVGNVDPLDRVSGQRASRRRLRPRVRRGVAIERDFLGKFPIAGSDIAGSGNGAVLDVERVDINAQPFRRLLKKDLANLGAGMTQRAARLLDREAARRDALVGAARQSTPEPSARATGRYRVRRRRSAPAPSRCLARSPPFPARPSPVPCPRISATTTISG